MTASTKETCEEPDNEQAPVPDARAAVQRLFEERERVGMSLWDMEAGSGIPLSTAYAWRKGARQPTFGNLVALANMLGFEIVMRRATKRS